MRCYYERILADIKKYTNIPFYIVRFEDLRREPNQEMTNVFKFLLNVDSIEGTVLESRIDKLAVKDAKGAESYNRKYYGYDFNRNKHLFNEEQIAKI
mmetsp:Transcript_32980/g.23812  ORF Transcript_32980/g.23812 Transcript_32980/m.23812 type:complete len:97 (+) Transcript_32980:921-1211(+)|eukprot:CAMPEP_0116874350 /NCGR_PEP_ID=MMETSP0463-20121206/5790_1 /TAXON_ID=181622 /ORGANISM="Strombidinopsis sp, Strain SopsisLIS2011" /LENGTH=96 /DNA_ID=CAMNT_0004517863 /DNA_START=928 /DNA_END=1218 /DNA_ORIENTATION=-